MSRDRTPPPRKRRKRVKSPNSFGSVTLVSVCHWLWIALWESSTASERKAAAQVIGKALKELETSSDAVYWKYRLARVFVEFHNQRNPRKKDSSLLVASKRDWRRTMEGIVWLFDLLYGRGPTGASEKAEGIPPGAFFLACNRSLGILKTWTEAVWEVSQSFETNCLTDEAVHRAGQMVLWNSLFQLFVQTDRPDELFWLRKLRQELWLQPRIPTVGNVEQWTPLGYLIAAKVRSETSSLATVQQQIMRKSSSTSRRAFCGSSGSSKGLGVPSTLLSTITDPFQKPIRLMEYKGKSAQVAHTTDATQRGNAPPVADHHDDRGGLSDHDELHEDDHDEDEEHLDEDKDYGEDDENKNSAGDHEDEVMMDEAHVEDDEDDDEEEEDDDDDDDDDEEEIDDDEAMEIDMDDFAEQISSSQTTHTFQTAARNASASTAGSSVDEKDFLPVLQERRKAFLQASLEVVLSQYPVLPAPVRRLDSLTAEAESSVWEGMIRVIQPPKPPAPSIKVILRRAPTQEEFFRGNLSTNPVDLDLLRRTSRNAAVQSDDSYEPTVGDLRQHIANDLQMGDSAELIEILIANKIVSTDLKLRVIHQVVWRQHLLENSTTTRDGAQSFVSMGSGISMIFSSSRPGRGHAITAETPSSQLPPMIAVYRLAGVDGEATEDTVDAVVDPEAPDSDSSPEAREAQIEKEFGLTRLIAEGRGFNVLLRSIQFTVESALCRIRRDQVGLRLGETNLARESFQKCPPCQGLVLLRHCTKVSSNRTKLLRARAPTVLLTLLLEVLQALSHSGTEHASNPTGDILQELIESLSSDISASSTASGDEVEDGFSLFEAQDASSMPLLLESIEKISLKANLRGVISKLLPFLTYGQADLSRSLAQHFTQHIDVDELAKCEDENTRSDTLIMMKTFVETLIGLPASAVCNALRAELIHCNFIDKVAVWLLKGIPSQPPTWTPSLWTKKDIELISQSGAKKKSLDDAWRSYFDRRGVRTAIQILIGLCKKHKSTQARIAMSGSFLQSIHWIEATSDHSVLDIETNGLGLLAETLLDEITDENSEVSRLVEGVRRKTKFRKRELAQERRMAIGGKMTTFGGATASISGSSNGTGSSSSVRGTAASFLGSVVDFFGGPPNAPKLSTTNTRSTKSQKEIAKKAQPSWMAEMEAIEEECGITCAICQEGQKLQPEELLGLYAYVSKVAIPLDQCGARSSMDGSTLLKNLPGTLPMSLTGKKEVKEWFSVAKAAAADHSITSSYCSTFDGKRCSLFTTTVTAGNAIHISCHRKAKQADRNHPKAPKSEWEGAKLRNGRVDCNVILPLVSSRSSKVSLIAVDSALSDHQTAVSNVLGTNAKSSLWTTLFDARFLLLRFAYGEALNSDCGGGSLASNCQLLFHHLTMADMFEKNAQLEQPELSQHVRGVSAAFLAACAMITDAEVSLPDSTRSNLTWGVADSAPLAAMSCILFHNQHDDSDQSGEELEDRPHPRRRWVTGREYFLKGLLISAGRRKALGVEGSGCLAKRNLGKRLRSSSFAEWESQDTETDKSSKRASVEDFQNVLRPMLTLFVIFETVSTSYHGQMDDVQIQEASESLVRIVEKCLGCKNIHELLGLANTNLEGGELVDLLQKGMVAA